MSAETVARRYAIALADVVIPNGEAREVQEELLAWERMQSSNELLLDVLGNPTVPYDQKQKLLSSLISRTKLRPTTANFLQVLMRNQRILNLPQINDRFAHVLDERGGVVSAQVTTAHPVDESIRGALERQLTTMTGKRVRLSFDTDQEIIGGVITRIGSTVYDGSIRNQLNEARHQLAGTR
jgi:F-type H+-transporting ATPase subunit delta